MPYALNLLMPKDKDKLIRNMWLPKIVLYIFTY